MRFKLFVKRNKIQCILFIIAVILLFINVILWQVSEFFIHRMPDQLTADRWSSDTKAAQVSIFVTEDQSVSESLIPKMKYNLEKKLEEAGVYEPEEPAKEPKKKENKIIDTIGIDEMNANNSDIELIPETAVQKLYRIAYSAQGTIDITYGEKTVDNASAVGVGGDFFLFHPMELVAGAYLLDDPLMKDGIVIDEDVAWQLFGSSEVVGETVMIGEIPHFIRGVVRKPKGEIEKDSGLSKSYVFLSYDSLAKYGEILSGKTSEGDDSEDGPSSVSGGINCIEVVCPNPVDGIAARMSLESSELHEDVTSVIDNTNRFSFFSLLTIMQGFGKRSMWSKAIYYPYWENIARGYEDRLAIILAFRIFCVVMAAFIAVVMIIIAYRNKTWTIESVLVYLADKKYDLEVERNLKKQDKQQKHIAPKDPSGGEECYEEE